MKVNRTRVAAVIFVFVLAFLFLVPVISYAFPPGLYNCPANGCNFPRYGSVTYWGLGVGGIWTYANSYSISAVTTITPISATSSVSYTISAEPASTTTTATNPTNDLELQISLNTSSSSATGVSVNVLVDAYNPLLSPLNVTAANTWALPLNGYNGVICGDDGPTVGFAIAQGHYTSSNITTASFLDLVNPTISYSCSLYFGYANPTSFLFQPLSDMAASYGCIGQSPCMPGTASTGGPVTGYWNQAGVFTSFPRGVYTVVAEDEWGGLALEYFTVSSS